MDKIPSLNSLVGEKIIARIDAIDDEKPRVVKLLLVENAGIWVESDKIIQDFLAGQGVSASLRTVVVFVPWNHVHWILGFADYPALSEKGFGL
jgi:hypothetical protein